MRCYGAKPRAFLDLVGDGTMPVLVVDGVVYPSSRSALAKVCDEARFPPPRHPSLGALAGGASAFIFLRGPRARVSAFLVDRGHPGFEITRGPRCVSQRAYLNFVLSFNDCRVSEA